MDAASLYQAHHAELLRYLIRLTGDADLAQDAVQESFARLVATPPRDDNPRAWLFTVATNLARGWARTRSRRAALLAIGPERVPLADAAAAPDRRVEADERKRLVRAALNQLSEKERTILLMREEGFTHREIAEAVGTTTGSVGTMIARALDKLAASLPLDQDAL